MQNHSIEISRHGAVPIYRQIYERVRDAVRSGALHPGDRVPSSRGLASELGVARGTVEEAYDLLTAEGYLMRNGQRGSIVSTQLTSLPVNLRAEPPQNTIPRPLPGNGPQSVTPFQLGLPAMDAFPRTLWSRLTSSQARKVGSVEMTYPDPAGFRALRESIAQYLALARGVQCTPEQIVVTNGYQGGLDLVCRQILDPGDKVWLEDPGYFRAQKIVLRSAAEAVPVGVDGEGQCVGEGMRLASDARLTIVTPSHHSPTCVAMSLPRRMELLSWATGQKAWIVEDDYDGEFHYSGKRLPALKSLDTEGRVIYAGSFSKTIFPSLRLGYLVLPDRLLEDVVEGLRLRNGGVATFQQAVTAAFMAEGHFTRHLKRMRALYARRRQALAESLQEVFGGDLKISLEDGGMNVIAALPDHIRDVDISEHALTRGFSLQPLSANALKNRGHNALIFGFTNVPEEQAPARCRELAKVIGPAFKRPRRKRP